MIRIALSLALLMTAACATSPPKTPDQEVEAFMWDYTRTWNRHDAAGIAQNFYRMPGRDVAAQTAANVQTFAGLVAQGYDHSDIREIKTCVTGLDRAWAGMKFSRLKADGTALPPTDRASSYELQRFPDGWRIVRLMGYDAAQPLACPAAG
jgi:hypothetical protein